MGHGRAAEEDLRHREAENYLDKVRQAEMGEQNNRIKLLEKKADQARQMRDFLAYKQFQKDLEKEKQMRDKGDYGKIYEDANRK